VTRQLGSSGNLIWRVVPRPEALEDPPERVVDTALTLVAVGAGSTESSASVGAAATPGTNWE
jgi:hypothetical protein